MSRLVIRSLCIAAVGLLSTWLLLANGSPLWPWAAARPSVTNVVTAVNLPTMLFALANFPGSLAPSNAAVVAVATVQWLAYGFAVAWLWCKLGPNNSSKPTPLRGAA